MLCRCCCQLDYGAFSILSPVVIVVSAIVAVRQPLVVFRTLLTVILGMLQHCAYGIATVKTHLPKTSTTRIVTYYKKNLNCYEVRAARRLHKLVLNVIFSVSMTVSRWLFLRLPSTIFSVCICTLPAIMYLMSMCGL